MKESVSVTTIFQIVILFILLFTAIMCLTINNSNAFGVKDEIINIIEMNNGNYLDGDNLSTDIVDAISQEAYRTTGICEDGYTGYERNGAPVNTGDRASVCIKVVNVTSGIESYLDSILDGVVATDFVEGKYYQIVLFYQLDLPVLRQAYNFQTKGETRIIYQENRSVSGNGSYSGNSSNRNISNTPFSSIDDSIVNGTNDNNINVNNESSSGTVFAEEQVCREGIIENNLITGIQGVAMAVEPIYTTSDKTTSTRSTRLDGTKFTILGNDGTSDGSGLWAITYDGECGWVESNYMAINLREYIPSITYSITNASSSIYKTYNGTSAVNIPNLTGQKLYTSDFSSIVPVVYSFAQKLRIAQSNAQRNGDSLKIYDAYRPYKVTQYASSQLSSLRNSNSQVRYHTNYSIGANTGNTYYWHESWFLAQNVSKHNTGCAVDITLSGKESQMPTDMHQLSTQAIKYYSSNVSHTTGNYSGGMLNSQAAQSLSNYMMSGTGLTDLASEWWHYQDDSCHSRITGHSSTGGGRNINFYSNV